MPGNQHPRAERKAKNGKGEVTINTTQEVPGRETVANAVFQALSQQSAEEIWNQLRGGTLPKSDSSDAS